VDVLGRDGPYVSVLLTEWACCPDQTTARCGTLDVRDGHWATLDEYDDRHAAKRWDKAREKAPDLPLDRDAFVVGDGHVRFCVVQDGGLVQVQVR
jgi:hypothetical protein